MKSIFAIILMLVFVCIGWGQAPQPTPSRPRVVGSFSQPQPTPSPFVSPTSTPTPAAVVVVTNTLPIHTPTPIITPSPTPFSNAALVQELLEKARAKDEENKDLSFGDIRNKINEAKRLMQLRPVPTAITSSFIATDIIRLAFYDPKTAQIDFVVMTKPVFLSRDSIFTTTSSNGKPVTVRILRANGVNTAVTITDSYNQQQTPLLVQYPIEKGGSFREMAYYISTHPGLVTPEVVSAGKMYVRNTIDIARDKLKNKGILVSPQIADIAERLATVEHVDHQRFWNENQPQIYNEIFTLYALNEGNTYRYSVSSAGAGGMVQMIPSTYNMVRSRYYSVGLIPDFVEGMRNHQNAAQAMLLYMQMTWNDLASNDSIYNAMTAGLATQAELMAAGYNSNPAKLAGYLRRGGNNWRTLIPRETQIYLQIYSSLENAVPMIPRTK